METSYSYVLIGTAAQLAGVHIQTLRVYEEKGLVTPQRSAGGTRRYSPQDIHRLQRLQALSQQGVNLIGAQKILELEDQLYRAQEKIALLEQEMPARPPRSLS